MKKKVDRNKVGGRGVRERDMASVLEGECPRKGEVELERDRERERESEREERELGLDETVRVGGSRVVCS